MLDIASKTTHLIIGTATPIQTDPAELWDLLEILNHGADHVLGRMGSNWREPGLSRPILTGDEIVIDEAQAWNLLRNPLPPRDEAHGPFDVIYQDLGINKAYRAISLSDAAITDLDNFTQDELGDLLARGVNGLQFFQYHNPISRHVVLRRRKTLEDAGLMPKIAVDIWPEPNDPCPRLFEGKALKTTPAFDAAYEAVEKFTKALRQHTKGTGFMQNLLRQRLCSSVASGLSTCRKLIYDILGSLPDVIEDEWIEDVEALENVLKDYTRKKQAMADVFELRYGNFLDTNGDEWSLCEKVLDKDEAHELLCSGW